MAAALAGSPGRRAVPQPVLAWPLPADAGNAAPGGRRRFRDRRAGSALPACACSAGRRPSRSTGASNAPTGSSTIPFPSSRTGRADATASLPMRCGASTRSAWPSGWPPFPATCRTRAFPSATRGRCAPRWRCSSSSPSPFRMARFGGSVADAFRPQSAIDAIPPRIDAWVTPPAYTGKAPIFLTSDANQATPVFTVPEGSDVALRVTGGSGEETLSFSDASGNVRDIAANAPADPAKPAATAMQSVPRQFSGKLTDRRHAVAQSRRYRRSPVGVRRDPRQAAGDQVFRRAEARRQRHAGAELHDRGRLWRGLGDDRVRAGRAAGKGRAPALSRPRNAAFPAAPRRPGLRRQVDARPDRACLGRRRRSS